MHGRRLGGVGDGAKVGVLSQLRSENCLLLVDFV